jgi:hypothetical protein
MKLFSKLSLYLSLAVFLLSTASISFAQTKYPQTSPKATLMQNVGDTDIMITYHRPGIKGRTLWGTKEDKALVPFGEVWRAGANNATVVEISNDVSINGKNLPKGKYSFYAIPGADEWTLIFNKSWNQWGTDYDESEDALRVTTKPIMSDVSVESLRYTVENVMANKADIHLAWGKARIPFTIDLGDVSGRLLQNAQNIINNERLSAANYVFSTKQEDKYKMAVGWLDSLLAEGDSYGAMFVKARLLGEMGNKTQAIETAKKAVEFGKANKVNPRSVAFLENLIKTWSGE